MHCCPFHVAQHSHTAPPLDFITGAIQRLGQQQRDAQEANKVFLESLKEELRAYHEVLAALTLTIVDRMSELDKRSLSPEAQAAILNTLAQKMNMKTPY